MGYTIYIRHIYLKHRKTFGFLIFLGESKGNIGKKWFKRFYNGRKYFDLEKNYLLRLKTPDECDEFPKFLFSVSFQDFWFSSEMGRLERPSIKYVRKIFRKTNISNSLMIRNVIFSENFAHVLNAWPLKRVIGVVLVSLSLPVNYFSMGYTI